MKLGTSIGLTFLVAIIWANYGPAMTWAFGKKEWIMVDGDQTAFAKSYHTEDDCETERQALVERAAAGGLGDVRWFETTRRLECKSRRI